MSEIRLVIWSLIGALASCSSTPEAGSEGLILGHDVDMGPTDARIDAVATRLDATMSARPDMAVDLDADIVAGAGDASLDNSVEAECADACCQLTACQGHECDLGYCAAYCAAVRRDQVFSDWLGCFKAAGVCDDFSSCQRPAHPTPCLASCRFAHDVCGVAWLDDCQQVCNDPRLVGCLDDPLSCGDVSACLGEALVPGCGLLCEALASCGRDEGACRAECAASALADDPLPGLHLERDQRCLQLPIDGCEALTQCVDEDGEEVFLAETDEDEFCALYDGCALNMAAGCRTFYLEAREAGGWRAIDCIAETLGQLCAESHEALRAACFGPYNPTEEACDHYCLALTRCSGVPVAHRDPTCVNACMLQGTLHIATRTHYGRRVACRSAESCDSLSVCLDENPGSP